MRPSLLLALLLAFSPSLRTSAVEQPPREDARFDAAVAYRGKLQRLTTSTVLAAVGERELGITGDALQFAARLGFSDIVLLLIKNGHPQRQRDTSGSSLLHIAAMHGHANVTGVLLSNRASVFDVDNAGYTPVHAAAKLGHRDVLSLLLRKGGELAASGAKRVRTDDGGRAARLEVDSPLHLASQEGHVDCVSLLLASGADAAAPGLLDQNSVHVASEFGQPDVLRLLLESPHGHRAALAGDSEGSTPLHLAAAKGSGGEGGEGVLEAARVLLQYGADAQRKSNTGVTPLELAEGDEAMRTVLLQREEL